jgi:hypothetical protein
MGGCCSSDIHGRRRRSGGYFGNDFDEKEYYEEDEEDEMRYGDSGARIRLKGSSSHTSMHTQQGKKGINQDAMTIWEVRKKINMFITFFFLSFSTLISNNISDFFYFPLPWLGVGCLCRVDIQLVGPSLVTLLSYIQL